MQIKQIGVNIMKNSLKKIAVGVLSMAMVMGLSVPAMADDAQVYVSFLVNGGNSGFYITKGSDVTNAPDANPIAGYTFVGYDKSLKNVQVNTQYTAVYLPEILGTEYIENYKKTLAAPAVSATSVNGTAATAVATGATTDLQAQLLAILAAQQAAAAQTTTEQTAADNAAATILPVYQIPDTSNVTTPVVVDADAAIAAAWDASNISNISGKWATLDEGTKAAARNHYEGHGTDGWN